MARQPIVLGLTLCDYVIVEERTRKVSLIGTFTGLGVQAFPATIPPFSVFALLTDSVGEVMMKLIITHMESNEVVYTHRGVLPFVDVVAEVFYHLRLRQRVFSAPGSYLFSLLADAELIAQRRLRVYQREGET